MKTSLRFLAAAALLALIAVVVFFSLKTEPVSAPLAESSPRADAKSETASATEETTQPPDATHFFPNQTPPAPTAAPPPGPASSVAAQPNQNPAPATPLVPNPAPATPLAPNPAPGKPPVATSAPAPKLALGVPPPIKPAAKVFDPRFVQPATRLGLVGERTPEMEREIAEDAAKVVAEKAAAVRWAQANGWPVKGSKPGGGAFELMRIGEDGQPQYYETQNQEARISHNVEPLTQFGSPPGSPINLSGYGWLAGLWEAGPPRLSHLEFNDFPGRVVYSETGGSQDANNGPQDHATHVLGTILGNGVVDNRVRGMAWRASAQCYGWNDDNAEMRNNGATGPDQPSKLYVSNHSYGVPSGWLQYGATHATRANAYYWSGSNGAAEASPFGRYSSTCVERDKTCRLTPYHLPFFAAGNERGDRPPNGATIYFFTPDGSGGFFEVQGTWPNSLAPGADGSAEGGYDCLMDNGSAKNVMVVGNMLDAVSGSTRTTVGIGMSPSSSYGPADDGRIKPDVVGNGDDVLSATFTSDTAIARKTGTSMATPGATGTALLLHEHYRDMTGQYLRASTLKALMIHTATDVQDLGPDYASGWGLIDAVSAVAQIDLHAAEPGGYHIVEGVLSQSAPEFRVTFTGTGLIKATLCWIDPEGTAKSGLDNRTAALVNDLDLTLRAPDGTIYRAPQLNPLNPTAAAVYNGNTIDNVEMLGGFPLQPIPAVPAVYELTVTHKGTLAEPNAAEPNNKKQVFSLMLQGNVAATTGTIAEAVDKPDRAFTKHAAANASFAWESAASAVGGDRATNLIIDHNQKAGCETVVTGPVTVTFNWGVSSELNFDYLRFYNDGVKISEISGSVASTVVTYNVPAGTHTLRWAYEKDVSVSSGSDAGWFDNLEFNSLPEAVDNLNYTFTQPAGSTAGWTLLATTVSSVPTGDLAQSGNIAALQRSDMETIIQGPAIVRFRMVQTGPTGQLRAQWGPNLSSSILHDAGNTFKTYSIEIAAGPQTVRWSWYKPVAENSFGYVDELVVLPQPVSLRDAVDLPSNAANLIVQSPSSQPWIADTGDAAPSGPGGERGASSIHSIQTPGADNDTSIRWPIISSTGGTVSFWWQASGAVAGKMILQIRHDNVVPFVQAGAASGPRQIAAIPGGTPWQQVHLEIPPGYTELNFFYDATNAAGQGWLDQIKFQEGLMHPARGLDRWGSRWETFGDAPWAAVFDSTNGGIDSTTHSAITHNQSTSLTTYITGPKKLFFQWKASSETNFDFLRLEMDGQDAVPPISGETGWRSVALDIPAGTHFLRWLYRKDDSLSAGQDRGWIDQVAILRADFGLGLPTPNGTSFVLLPVRKDATAGFFVEQSTDLVTWTPAGTADGMVTPRFTNVNLILPYLGTKTFYRMRFKPEIVQTIENAGFELPVAAPNAFSSDAPGWGPDGDGFTVTSFENIPGFAAEGTQHLSIAAGAFSEMKGTFLGWRGVHSVAVAIGNRPGFTQAGNFSNVVLTSGPELARTYLGGTVIPSGAWMTAMPVSYDSFETNLDANYVYKVRLESIGNRSFYDNVRVVSEPQ